MKMPVHYVHHKYGMWHHNFGLAVDWWDHVFGTYKPVEWLTEEEVNSGVIGNFGGGRQVIVGLNGDKSLAGLQQPKIFDFYRFCESISDIVPTTL